MIALPESIDIDRRSRIPAELFPDAAAVLIRVRAVLSRRRITEPDCHCDACIAVMARPFRCGDCGYTGAPTTHGCTCHQSLRSKVCFNTATLQQYTTDAAWPAVVYGWKVSRTDLVRETARLRRIGRTIRHIALCQGEGRGMPNTDGLTFSFEGNCSHAFPFCAACGGHGDSSADDEHGPALSMLREVNAILDPANSAPTSATITRMDDEVDGIPLRELRCASPSIGDHEILISLGDTSYLERGTLDPRAIELRFTTSAESIDTFLLPDELDALIANLAAVRDRAHADGIVLAAVPS